ncbi:MAG: hypothetical protein ACO3A4_06905 [Silvanigrellaceae bacterium]
MRHFRGLLPVVSIAMSFVLSACESKPSVSRDKVKEAWDNYNNPALLDAGSVVVFDELPRSGRSVKIPWADIYWPSHLGGIALRWQSGIVPPFSVPRLSESEVRKMTLQQVAALSPAEKYDIFMGRFDFPTVQAELMRTHPAMPEWAGLCHGWASASLNFDEPGAVTLKGVTGVEVPFGSGDIKALLAYAQGVVFLPFARVLGQRCEIDFTTRPELRNTAECRDTNAGSFHLILTNLIGREGQNVIADLTRGSEVWNFPIYGYSTRELGRQLPSPGAAPQAVSEVIVETDVEFLVEIESPNWLPIGDNRTVASENIRYNYIIEIDSLGRIVGGRWLSDERPDFVWVQERADFRGYYKSIETIYDSSRLGMTVGGPIAVATPTSIPTPTPTPFPTPVVDAPSAPGLSAEPTPNAVPPAPTAPAVPSAPPQPTPYPVPTPPGFDPSQPIGPVLTQPIPLPTPVGEPVGSAGPSAGPATPVPPPNGGRLPDVTSAIECPPGTIVDGGSNSFCTDGMRAYAPYTNEMQVACGKIYGPACYDSLWTNQMYSSLRGNGVCPLGSDWNTANNVCVEGSTALGPFSRIFVEKCLAAGFGNLCRGMKIDLAYLTLANLAR